MFGVLKLGKLGASMKKAGFNPSTLFAASEPGAWYDPSDMSTMFQDSAGSTPVTAVGQPVGLLLDKSKGLVLGPELVTNPGGPFAAATGWSDQQGNAPLTVSGGNLVATPTSTGMSRTDAPIATVAGKWYTLTVNMVQFSGPGPTLAVLQTRNGSVVPGTSASGTVGITTFKFLAVGSSVYLTFGSNVSVVGVANILSSATIKEIPGNHAKQATTTARPMLQQDANGKYYLDFDGIDDSLVTGSINFTATDKMSVFAGITRDNESASVPLELSNTLNSNVGTFNIISGTDGVTVSGYTSKSRGSLNTTLGAYVSNLHSPNTSVISSTHDISGDLSTIRVNAVAGVNGTQDKGTGNFGNYPLYIGARAGTSAYFNGRIYSLIVRGALSDAAQIAAAEAYVAGKTGVTL